MSFQQEETLCSAYIFLHYKRLKQVVNSIQSSSVVNSLDSFFFWYHIRVPLLCGFSPSLRMITLKNPYLFAPPRSTNTTMTRQHKQFPLTFIYLLAPKPQAFNEIPIRRGILVQIGCFSNSSPCFWCYLLNNMSIPQV